MAYTKAELEQIVAVQLENLDAMHDLLRIMKVQNELLDQANKKLLKGVSAFERKYYKTSRKKNSVKVK